MNSALETLKRIADHIETLLGEYEERAAEERMAASLAQPATARLRQHTAERHAGTALGLSLALSAIEAEIERLRQSEGGR